RAFEHPCETRFGRGYDGKAVAPWLFEEELEFVDHSDIIRPRPSRRLRGIRSMSRKAPFSGYLSRPQPDDDVLLTQVGHGTPGGEYLRRYWHPFMLASELHDLPVA